MLRGIVCPLMTPQSVDGTVDVEKLEALINHVVNGEVDALLVAGTNGEFFCLSDKNWDTLVRHSLSVLQHRKPAIVNVSHCSLHEAMQRAQQAQAYGADYITSTPPYYFALNQDEVVAYYHRLADASSLPLLLYNIAQYTKSDVYAILPRLLEHPRIVGMKDSSGQYERTTSIGRLTDKPFIRLIGTDTLLQEVLVSQLDGIVPGLANLMPDIYHKWWLALQANDRMTAQAYKNKILAFVTLYDSMPSAVAYVAVVRYGLHCIGLNVGEPWSPLQAVPASVQHTIGQTLDSIGVQHLTSSR